MLTMPTPNTPAPDAPMPLDQQVQDRQQELLVLMADADRCDDISSGIIV